MACSLFGGSDESPACSGAAGRLVDDKAFDAGPRPVRSR